MPIMDTNKLNAEFLRQRFAEKMTAAGWFWDSARMQWGFPLQGGQVAWFPSTPGDRAALEAHMKAGTTPPPF